MKIVSLSTKLPRAKDTAALSGGGLKRFVKSVGDTMFQLTTKMSESDQVMLMNVISCNCSHIITQEGTAPAFIDKHRREKYLYESCAL